MFNRGPELENKIRFLDNQLTNHTQNLAQLESKMDILEKVELSVTKEQLSEVKRDVNAIKQKLTAMEELQQKLNNYIDAQQGLNAEIFGMVFAFRDIIVQTELAEEMELEKAISHFKEQFKRS